MMVGVQLALSRVRDDIPNLSCPRVIAQMCRDRGHLWSSRVLDPSTTLFAFLTKVSLSKMGGIPILERF